MIFDFVCFREMSNWGGQPITNTNTNYGWPQVTGQREVLAVEAEHALHLEFICFSTYLSKFINIPLRILHPVLNRMVEVMDQIISIRYV